MNIAEQLEKMKLEHSELVEAHEVLKAEMSDAIAKIEAHNGEVAKLKEDHKAAIEASEQAKVDALAKATESQDATEKLQAEFDALKAKMELTPALNDVTEGSAVAVQTGEAAQASSSVDHAKVYAELQKVPGIAGAKACAKYREEHGKELGLK